MPADATPLDDLVAKHIDWLGGRELLEAAETVSMVGTLSASGLTGSIEIHTVRGGSYRLEYDLEIVRSTEVVSPDGTWTINNSGQVEELGETSARNHRRSSQGILGSVLLGESEATLSLMNDETKDGVSWKVLRTTYPNGDIDERFVDPLDGHSVWTRSTHDTATFWIKSSEWRLIDGLRFPARIETLYDQAIQNSTTILTEIRVNEPIDPILFRAPASKDVGIIRSGEQSTEWVPIETFLDAYIYVRGAVNGQSTDILLDSGAGITVIDARTAANLGIEGAGSIAAQGVAGQMEASIVEGIGISIGELELSGLTAAILDLSGVEKMLGRSMPVILGKEVFNNFIVDVDYPNNRIAFHEQPSFAYTGNGSSVELFPGEDGHKLVEIVVEGHEPALVTIDTGARGALTLFAHYTRSEGLLESRSPISTEISGGVGGTSITKVGTLRTLEIGRYDLHEVPVGFHVEEVGSFNTRELAGNLGAGILSRFRVLFDYSRSQLHLEPGPDWQTRPFERDRLGLKIMRNDNGISVLHVAAGSPAEAAGCKEGDLVVSVDGIPLGDDYRTVWRRVSRQPVGTLVSVSTASGTTRTMTLTEYF